ncbi:MAG: phage exclusion protein Lit family protein [Gluconobacter potus]|uniref:phage exclusion protein Lit family protein n=1 Tax=Gluconobacter potus TaxID=2724927 RepID=UPI0039EC89CC
MSTEPSDRTIVLNLLRGAVPERDTELCQLWKANGHAVEVVASSPGVKMDATDKRIQFDPKTIDLFWLIGFSFWRSIEVYSPAIAVATCTNTSLEKALSIDEERGLYEADFRQLIAAGQELIAESRSDDFEWPESVPLPTTDSDSLGDVQDKAAADLVALALAFALLHELKHVTFRLEGREKDMPRNEEEMACDTWARAFMTEKVADYARKNGHEYMIVAQKRAMGIALAGAIIHAMTAPNDRWGSEDYPPLCERLRAIFDGHTLPDNSSFWTFAACILVALLRQQHVRLDFKATTHKEMVDRLFAELG